MKAAYYTQTGPATVIQYGELPTPEPTADEVRVKVAAASLNPVDTYIRGGVVAMKLPHPQPFVPGCDFAGVVDAVGANVTKFKVGDRVWGSNQGLLGRQGTTAEYVCPPQEFVYHSPANVSDVDLAATALVGITAHLGLFMAAKTKAREFVFVNGGTGGVGSAVVQMAKAVGATVITTVGSAEKAALAKQLGADFTINYKAVDVVAEVKKISGQGLHVYYETLREPDYDKIVDMMRPRARIVVMAGRVARPPFPHGPFYVKGLTLSGFAMFNIPADEQQLCADDIGTWLADGRLKANIAKTFKFSETAVAHQLQEANTVNGAGSLSGKIVLVPG